ncbi:non-homologous end-joining DNA ligase [Nocardioides sp.]|uniref:non-homologous end-joining DNA ligase n=1 Tax=Nocardioides sp. TaxID=35761 RepID=UPI0035626574
MRPMLATRGTHVPTGPEWSHEVKWDGMRILADVRPDGVRLTSRNENDVTVTFPELHALAGRDLLLDGEVVAFADGVPSFGALAERIHVHSARRAAVMAQAQPVTFLIFDLLRLDGRDLTGEPLAKRRELLTGLGLTGLGLAGDHWHVPDAYDDGDMLFEATLQQGLEGIVSKRLSSRYHPGRRSPDWLKFPHRRRSSYVVGGWRAETGSDHRRGAQRLGALLVGEPTPDGLLYRGRVGSGIAGARGPQLLALLEPLARASSPFADEVPRVDATGTHWVDPSVVVDVEALGLSTQQRLRQPSYRGVRSDLDPADLIEEHR